MRYTFPITASVRKLLPQVDNVISSVEGYFRDFTGETLKLSYGDVQVMTFSVTSPVEMDAKQISHIKAIFLPLLAEKFPDSEFAIGDPTFTP